MTKFNLTYVEMNPSESVIATVIWMHGLGADGHDFADIVPQLKLAGVRFIFPHAPIRPVSLNGGYPMRAWYDIHGLDFNSREDAVGIQDSAKLIDELIQREIESGIPAEKILLAGFSQGGALALYCGLRHPKKLAGIMALSAYLPQSKMLVQEASEANKRIPIFMAHGTQDNVVDVKLAEYSHERLQGLSYQVDFHYYPMAHSVCFEEIQTLADWVAKIIY